jgi:hypothetical protein
VGDKGTNRIKVKKTGIKDEYTKKISFLKA